MRFRWLQMVALVLAVPLAPDADATSFVPVTPEDLTRSSVATVVGTATGITGVEADDGRVYTLVDIAVEDVLAGQVPSATITLKELGGVVGGRRDTFFGTPSFKIGERVLLFLTVWPDGSLRTNHLALGKFDLDLDGRGMPVVRQNLGVGVTVLARPDQLRRSRPLSGLRAAISSAVPAAVPLSMRARPPEATDPRLPREVSEAFTLLGSSRFFEPDRNLALSFLIDQTGDSTIGLDASRAAVDGAFAAWTQVMTSNIVLEDGGLTSDLSIPCEPPHKVRFNDPFGEIPDPVNCEGTLGVGGFCSLSDQTKVVNGQSFDRSVRGVLTLANGWEHCPQWTPCNVAEVATHEIGHTLGLGHSSVDPTESNPLLLDATMYYMAHFDGRCAGVRTDDIDGISFVYPTNVPPSIVTERLPRAFTGIPYRQELQATGGSGQITWSLQAGSFPGIDLSPSGVLEGTPEAHGTSFFRVTATDENGDSHTKSFDFIVDLEMNGPLGDANCDGTVSAADLPSLVMRIPTNDVEPCGLADAVPDGVLDAADVAATIRNLFPDSSL